MGKHKFEHPSFTRKELRCVKRKDLVEALAKNLPAGTIRFGCGIEAIVADSADGHCTVLSTADSNTIKAKVSNYLSICFLNKSGLLKRT